jgi:D-glycero-alpha-D-manno-heptose 1-phosphate guanylyltransferase
MQGIVLAGGFGTRLRQVVTDVPKPMASIAGRPFLEILLNAMAAKGFTKIVLSVGFMAEKIIDYFGCEHAGMELIYALEEKPLGTGGGVRLALSHITEDHVFVLNGDTFLDLEVNFLERLWQQKKRSVIVGRQVPDAERYGRLIANEGVAIAFSEKNTIGPGLINAGCYLLKQHQLDDFQLGSNFSLETDFLTSAIARGEFDVFVTSGMFIDIGVPEDYAKAQTLLINQ